LTTVEQQTQLHRLRLAATLERNTVARRYHQANVTLMARVWTHYLGFVTGMTLALVGAAFVLGRISEESSELQVGAGASTPSASLRTASPGLVLGAFGVVLMIVTIVTHHEIETKEVPVYFGRDGVEGKGVQPDITLVPTPALPASR
jgi:hypothetical protein